MQFDWDAFFKPCVSSADVMHGFTSTKYDRSMVRAFKVAKQPDGTVQVFYKKSAGLVDKWCGVDGTSATSGCASFRVLSSSMFRLLLCSLPLCSFVFPLLYLSCVHVLSFILLRSRPHGTPTLVEPDVKPMKNKYKAELLSEAHLKMMQSQEGTGEREPPSFTWLRFVLLPSNVFIYLSLCQRFLISFFFPSFNT